MALFLVECRYVEEVTFLFLVKGHMKNDADQSYNHLKIDFHKLKVFTMKQLLRVLRGKNKEEKEARTVSEVEDGDFEDWGNFLDEFYQPFEAGVISNNHMFTVKAYRPTTV